MGMDVFGKAPSGPEGEYFRRNVWGWHPLWNLVEDLVPELASKVEYPHSNDGDGLGAEDSAALAARLEALVASGEILRYCFERDEALKALPDQPCQICGGTGLRAEPPQVGPGPLACNGCQSTGKIRPFETHYDVEVQDVQEFATFLKECGGFEIC